MSNRDSGMVKLLSDQHPQRCLILAFAPGLPHESALTLGALFTRGGPAQDPVLTVRGSDSLRSCLLGLCQFWTLRQLRGALRMPQASRLFTQVTTRWSPRVSLVQIFERSVTEFAPHTALKLIA